MKIFSFRNVAIAVILSAIIVFVALYIANANSKKVEEGDQKAGYSVKVKEYSAKIKESDFKVYDSKLLAISDSEFVIGSKNAKVTFIDYASLSCPHCAAFYGEAFDQLKKEYIDTGKVKFVYRDFPLNQPSLIAATIAICRSYEFSEAQRAKRYHEFVKLLYDAQNSWVFSTDAVAKLESIAVLDGMSKGLVKKCARDVGLQDSILKARMLAARDLEIESTPTFFVNGRKVQGFVGYKKIKELIDIELNK